VSRIKLKLFTIAIVAIIMTLIANTSLAYHTTVGRATNVITTGGVTLKIHETTDQGTPFPEEGVDIIPGDVVSKQVSIENVCEEPFYLRVKIVYGVNSDELSASDCFKLNIDSTNWRLVDGWYYYTSILEPHTITPNVFSHVEIVGNKVDNSYIGKTLTLTVKAQAVQSKNNPVDGNNTHTAYGWPQD